MLPYVKYMTSASLMHEAGHSKASALGHPRRIGWGRRWEGEFRMQDTCSLMLIHVDVWQKPQYCKVIILQLKSIIFFKLSITPSNSATFMYFGARLLGVYNCSIFLMYLPLYNYEISQKPNLSDIIHSHSSSLWL